MKLTLITMGAFMLGWMIPEYLGAIMKQNPKLTFNAWAGTGAALLAAGIFL